MTRSGTTVSNGLDTPIGLAWRDDLGELWAADALGDVGVLDVVSGGFASKVATGMILG